jgi:hypothetical protein
MRDIIYKRIQIKRLLEDDNLGLAAYCFILEIKTDTPVNRGFWLGCIERCALIDSLF